MVNSVLVKNLFNRRALKLGGLRSILDELAKRMISRLDYIKVEPNWILDCGSGLSCDSILLQQKYPDVTLIKLDLSHAMLKSQQKKQPWLEKLLNKQRERLLCGDALSLPLANSSIDFYYSNMLLPYIGDLVPFVKEMRRVLTIGGSFCIAGLGVDSFKELRELGLTTHSFPDMHDIGDILLTAGFTNPVVDTEYITLDYEELYTLLSDIRLVGCGSAFTSQNYLGKEFVRNLHNQAKLSAKLTLEVFVAHGWKDQMRIDLPEGLSEIRFNSVK